jgi:hypothetical protein
MNRFYVVVLMLTFSSFFCMLSTNLELAGISFIRFILETSVSWDFSTVNSKCFHENQFSTRHHKRAGPANKLDVVHLPILSTLCWTPKKIGFNLNSLNTFTKKKTGSNKLKLPKVGSNAIVTVPVGAGPNKQSVFCTVLILDQAQQIKSLGTEHTQEIPPCEEVHLLEESLIRQGEH